MQYTLNIFTLALFLFASCKPEANPENPIEDVTKQVKKIASSPTDFRSFIYDQDNHLINYSIQFINGNGASVMSTAYSYVDGVINTSSSQSGSVFYETEGQQVKAVRSFRPLGSEISTINYSYNNKGQVIEWREKFRQPEVDQPVESKQTFEYYADGNLKRTDYYLKYALDEPFVLNGSTVYDQYDLFKNPDQSFTGLVYLPGVVFQKNNARRMRHYAANGLLYQTNTFEYTYDVDGYPATKRYSDDRSTVSVLFTYTY